MDKIEKMFLDLNSVLVKFWIEQGRPDKELKIALLERMLNWYKKMGYVTPQTLSKEPVCLYDGEAPNKQKCGDCTIACSVRVEEEPDKSLEEAAEEYSKSLDVELQSDSPDCFEEIIPAFKAGAEWRYQKDRGEFAKIKAKTWCEGFDAHKEQIMKEAVEGEVHPDDCEIWVNLVGYGYKFNDGDKVRIIVLPKEGEK